MILNAFGMAADIVSHTVRMLAFVAILQLMDRTYDFFLFSENPIFIEL